MGFEQRLEGGEGRGQATPGGASVPGGADTGARPRRDVSHSARTPVFPEQDGQAEEMRETEGKTRGPGPRRSSKDVDVDSEGNETRRRDLIGLLF